MFGIGYLPVEVIAVYLQQQIGKNLLGTRVEILDIIPITSDHHQVCCFLQGLVLAVGSDQGGNIFPGIGAGEGQDDRFFRFP